MLTIRCAKCKTKLFKYKKIGFGKILKCYKDRMDPLGIVVKNGNLSCACNNIIGIEMGSYFKMKANQFVYTGKKDPG